MRLCVLLLCLFFTVSCSHKPVLRSVQNGSVSEQQWKDQWVIVNYWAAWCEGCMKEIPELNRFYQHHHDKSVLLYGVNFDGLQAEI